MIGGTATVLSRASGLPLAAYRDRHVGGSVRRALEREGVPDESALAELLRADARARERFRRSVAVSVSGPFRDPSQFELLQKELLPPLVAGGRAIRIWSAGCADGSELFSVAILFDRLGALERATLLGSDLLEENLAKARGGCFHGQGIEPRIRARVRWEQRDLVRDGAPPGSWDLILCRNVAIYLSSAPKQALHELLASTLAPGGVLLLGRAERLSNPNGLGLERAGPHAYRKAS